METKTKKYLTADEYIKQSQAKWDTVVQALADLYHCYTEEDDHTDALIRLIEAYDDWLD